jgi:MFS family permease
VADSEPLPPKSGSRAMAPGGALAPFRVPAFRAIWIANLASNLGAMIQSIGAAWLMTELTDSHRLIALVQASTTIPIMLFGVFAGAIADNFDRRRVMLSAQCAMLLVSAVLALVTWLGAITPGILLACTLAVGTGTALNSPAWQASVRQQVGTRDLPQAISLNTISFNLGRSVGPALGGVLISLWGVALAFALNAVSYVAMIVVLLRWRPVAAPRARQAMLAAIRAGVGFCFGTLAIRRLMLRGLALGFGFAGWQGLVPSVARNQLGADEFGFGLILGAFGIGSIAAALVVSGARRRWGGEPIYTAGVGAAVVAMAVLARVDSVTYALPAALLAGAAWVTTLTGLNVAVQMLAPETILGRSLSIYQAATFGGMALGAWSWGSVADWLGLPVALYGAALWLAVTLAALRILAPMPWPGAPDSGGGAT